MKKTYVLDTNVLLHDAQALFRFEDNDVVIPMTVIEEIDRFKKDLNETGRNARQISRTLDGLREKTRLMEGVPLEAGGVLKVVLCSDEALHRLPLELRGEQADNRILAVAADLMKSCECPVVFVTKDTNLRIKADVIGLAAEDYETGKVPIDELYSGQAEVMVDKEIIDRFYGQGYIEIGDDYRANECVTLIDSANLSHTGIGRFHAPSGRIVALSRAPKEGIWGIQPRNREQQFAIDILLY
jgi:PhoH-like ATPase